MFVYFLNDRLGPSHWMYTGVPIILLDRVTVHVNVYEVPTRPCTLEPVTSTDKVFGFKAVRDYVIIVMKYKHASYVE